MYLFVRPSILGGQEKLLAVLEAQEAASMTTEVIEARIRQYISMNDSHGISYRREH